jgi:hypothetical protein
MTARDIAYNYTRNMRNRAGITGNVDIFGDVRNRNVGYSQNVYMRGALGSGR